MRKIRFKVTNLIVLTVFCIFAVCTMAVLLTGAEVYGRLADRTQMQFDQRTAARYITTRVRQSDVAGDIRVEDFGGYSSLVFQEQIEGQLYETRIYCYEGYVRELFVSAEGVFLPEDGEKVLKAKDLEFVWDGNILTVYITLNDQKNQKIQLYLHSGKEGVL